MKRSTDSLDWLNAVTLSVALGMSASIPGASIAAGATAGAAPATAAADPAPGSQTRHESTAGRSLAEDFCRAVREPAREARHAVRLRELEDIRKLLEERVQQLNERIAELKSWSEKREAFSDRARAQLVAIYAAMRPESASEQLAQMEETTAAAILSKLDPRAASAVLNDMPAAKAARLTSILAAVARQAEGKGS